MVSLAGAVFEHNKAGLAIILPCLFLATLSLRGVGLLLSARPSLIDTAQFRNPEIPLGEPAAAGWDLPLRDGPWGALNPPAAQNMRSGAGKLREMGGGGGAVSEDDHVIT